MTTFITTGTKSYSGFLFVCLLNYLVKNNGSGNPAVSPFLYTPNSHRGPRSPSLQKTEIRRLHIIIMGCMILLLTKSLEKASFDFIRSRRRTFSSTKSNILTLIYTCNHCNQDFYMISKRTHLTEVVFVKM